MKYSVSVIMPALNEENNISDAVNAVLESFDFFNIHGEVIVVSDGSTDFTEKIVGNIMKNNTQVRLLKHFTTLGIGASFWDGVDSSQGDIIVMLPGDNENDPKEIFRYYKLLDHVDIVIPFIFNRHKRPFFRNFLSFVYRFIINTTFLVNFNYTNGTILYRKSILKDLAYRSKSFFFQTDILVRSVKKGYIFAEVPYKVGERGGGRSKAITFPSLIQVMKGYLRLLQDYYYTFTQTSTLATDSMSTRRRKES